MILRKMSALKSLITSNSGVHITAYIKKQKNITQLKNQIRDIIDTSKEYLHHALKKDEESQLLEPFNHLMTDDQLLKNLNKNLGIFRHKNQFRILQLPFDVENICVVASSFHVKPILKWIQMDREFLFLGVTKKSISIYHGNQTTFKYITEATTQLNQWIQVLTLAHQPTLFLAGDLDVISELVKKLNYPDIYPESVGRDFEPESAHHHCGLIRKILRREANLKIKIQLTDFNKASQLNIAKTNIFDIGRAAVQGRVKKLLISEDMNLFGKLNRKTGDILIHPYHLDHEDDCLLDDLAQVVISKGGEVVVTKKAELPSGRPLLALVENSKEDLHQLKYSDHKPMLSPSIY